MSDKHLMLESLLNQNPDGIEAIYNIIFPKVRKFVVRNQGTEDDARDIFQKTLLQLITRVKVQGFKPIDSFEAYIFTACKNQWRRELNKKERVTKVELEEPSDERASDEMAVSILEQERWELYERCFQQLSENCRSILSMYFQKVSYGQIRKLLDYSSETVVRQRVFKCKAKLTELIKSDRFYNYLRTL